MHAPLAALQAVGLCCLGSGGGGLCSSASLVLTVTATAPQRSAHVHLAPFQGAYPDGGPVDSVCALYATDVAPLATRLPHTSSYTAYVMHTSLDLVL